MVNFYVPGDLVGILSLFYDQIPEVILRQRLVRIFGVSPY